MTAAPPGAIVRLHYDHRGPVEPGDAIVSHATGRAYIVEAARLQTRGLRAGDRWHLLVRVFGDAAQLPDDVTRHMLFWYPRKRTRRARRR